MAVWINTIIQGIMIGGLYAMFAVGLALIFGVMKLVNIAHGDLIVLSAYVALIVTQTLEINPLLSLVFVVPRFGLRSSRAARCPRRSPIACSCRSRSRSCGQATSCPPSAVSPR